LAFPDNLFFEFPVITFLLHEFYPLIIILTWSNDLSNSVRGLYRYDSELGRFISEDPAADPNNPNLYVYCANNPLVYIDPTGLLKLRDIGLANPGGVNYDPDIEVGGGAEIRKPPIQVRVVLPQVLVLK
jgi:hypothetical protein